MKSVIITGAGGFIGGALTDRLLDSEYKVYGLDINEIKKEHKNFVYINNREKTLEEILQMISDEVTYFFHMAWSLQSYQNGSTIDDCKTQLSNIQTSLEMFDLASKLKCKKFIFIGSNYQYMKYLDKSLSHKYSYSNIYGIGKRTAADFCRKLAIDTGMEYNNVLFANTYGVGDKSNKAVNTFIQKFLNGDEINLIEGNNLNDWVYIDDTVNGLIHVAEKGISYKEYYIGHKEVATFKDNLEEMKKALGSNQDLNFGAYYEKESVDYTEISLNELYLDTDFEITTDYKSSIKKTKRWLNDLGRIQKEGN